MDSSIEKLLESSTMALRNASSKLTSGRQATGATMRPVVVRVTCKSVARSVQPFQVRTHLNVLQLVNAAFDVFGV